MKHVGTYRDFLAAIGGTLVCALIVIFLDVIFDGSYTFSIVVCPIWFFVSTVRVILLRPRLSVAIARFLIPIATGLLVLANYSAQRVIAMGNAAILIDACEHYRKDVGAYPDHLSDLVPQYLSSVPRAKYCWWYSEFRYFGPPRPTLSWQECPPFARSVYRFETGDWHYID